MEFHPGRYSINLRRINALANPLRPLTVWRPLNTVTPPRCPLSMSRTRGFSLPAPRFSLNIFRSAVHYCASSSPLNPWPLTRNENRPSDDKSLDFGLKPGRACVVGDKGYFWLRDRSLPRFLFVWRVSLIDRKAEGVGIVLHNISVIIAMLLVGRMQGVEKCIARCKKAGLFSFGRSRGFWDFEVKLLRRRGSEITVILNYANFKGPVQKLKEPLDMF